jgi:hypothetical protein
MVIERNFGVTKKRFEVMNHGSYYPFETQVRLVPAMCAIHNFIRLEDHGELSEEFPEFNNLSATPLPNRQPSASDDEDNGLDLELDDSEASQWRDQIATQMWEDYQRQKETAARQGRRG